MPTAQTWFNEARLASTGNISLAGLTTIDGVTPTSGDRILVKDQTSMAQNGVYLADAGTWPRAVDFDGTTIIPTSEATIRVSEGTVNAHTQWYLATQGPISVGTSSLLFLRSEPLSVPTVLGPGANLCSFIANGGDTSFAGGYSTPGDGGGGKFVFQAMPPPSACLANPGSSAQSTSSMSTSASSPIVVTGAHPFAHGQAVRISGSSDSAANGDWIITYLNSTQFSLNGSTGTTGGTGASADSTVLTTQTAHGLTSGQQIVVGGVSGNAASLNGRWLPIGVLSSTTFSLPTNTVGAVATRGTLGDGGTTFPIVTGFSLGRWVRAASDPFDAAQFGAVRDLSSAGAINTSVHITMQNTSPVDQSKTEFWGIGDWYFEPDPVDTTAALHLTSVTSLLGAATARFGTSNNTGTATSQAATRFHIPDQVTAVKAWHLGMAAPRGLGAAGCDVSNILFIGSGQSSPNAHGIDIRTPARINNCSFSSFGGNGINISSADSGFPDNWRVDWSRSFYCQDGIHVVGGNANNGCCYSGDFQGNRGWGVYDQSFLGNGYVQCHTAENAAGAYFVETVGTTTLTNCYAEQDQPPSQVANTFIIGGTMSAGFTATSSYFGGSAANQMHQTGFLGSGQVNFSLTGVNTWTSSTSVSSGATVVNGFPTNGFIYQAQNSGTTGTAAPLFPTTVGASVSDNGITWKNVGIEPRMSAINDWVTDQLAYTIEVVNPGFPGGYDSFYPYSSQHSSDILEVRYSTDAGATWIHFEPSRADYGYNFGRSLHELGYSQIATSISSSSNGAVLPQGTISVVSTAGFPKSGTLLVQSSLGLQTVTYAATTGTTFTGCAGGLGTLATGDTVNLGGSGTTVFFTPYFYYADNVWNGTTYGGIVTQFQAGSTDSTNAAFQWGHFINGRTSADPRIDAGTWRMAYNANIGRWYQSWANAVTSTYWAGSRSLPTPGVEIAGQGLWSGDDSLGFNNLGWADLGVLRGTASWQSKTMRGTQWYSVGDLLLNNNQSTTPYPLALRAVSKGGYAHTAGYGYNTNWTAGLSIRVGDSIRPSTPNGYIYRAQPGGVTTLPEPNWSTALTLGSTVADGAITWTNVGLEDGYGANSIFEAVGVASPELLAKDCSSGGTITLNFLEVSHERYKLTGAPSAAFSLVIGTGAANSWDRSVWNTTSQSVTVKATSTDAGVTIPPSTAYRIFNDGSAITHVV